jgi:hypothetical protein
MTLEDAKEFIRIHNIKGDVIYASSDGGIYTNADFKQLQSLAKEGVTVFQVYPEIIHPEPEKKSKKE